MIIYIVTFHCSLTTIQILQRPIHFHALLRFQNLLFEHPAPGHILHKARHGRLKCAAVPDLRLQVLPLLDYS